MAKGLTPPRLAQPPRRVYPATTVKLDKPRRVEAIEEAPKVITTVKPRIQVGPHPIRIGHLEAIGQAKSYLGQGVGVNDVVSYIKDSKVSGGDGVYGYVLGKALSSEQLKELTPALRTWYDLQVNAMAQALVKAKAEAKKKIARLKARDEYEKNDAWKIRKRVYPKWSKTYRQSKDILTSSVKRAAKKARRELVKEAITLNVYKLDTQRGVKEFEAVSEEQAIRKAKTYGLDVKDVVGTKEQTLNYAQALDRIKTARARGVMDEAEAMITYGASLGAEIPKDSVPIRTEKGYRYLAQADVAALQKLPAYQEAKGDEPNKLRLAYGTLISSLEKIKPYINSFVTGLSTKVAGAEEENFRIIKATKEELEKVDKFCPGGVCPSTIVAIKTYKAQVSGGVTVYVEALDKKTAQKKAEEAGYKVWGVTKVVAPEGGWTYEDIIDVPKLIEEKGASKVTEMLNDVGVTNTTELIETTQAVQEFQEKLGTGEIIAVAGDEYITKEEYDKLPEGMQQIIKEKGFGGLTQATTLWWERLVPYAGPQIKPRERTGEFISHKEYQALSEQERGNYVLTGDSTKRVMLGTLAMMAPPAKAALPEYTMADVTVVDWAIAGANVALLAVAIAPAAVASSMVGKGIITGASSTISGVVGYSTAKNWSELTPAQRGLGIGVTILCAIPILTTVARNIKIKGSPPIATKTGDIVSWKGLSVAGHPIIGRSGGKWVLGTRNLTIPEARLILDGYHPQAMLETKVFVNRSAMVKAGFSKTQIDYLVNTLKTRNLFAGKMSPWLDKDVLISPTQRLNANEIDIVMRNIAKKPGQVKEASLLYGSPTIKAQAAPGLRNWRSLHDWDISLNLNQAATQKFTQTLLNQLKVKGGGTYRINPKIPTLIEKRIGGQWKHIVDIHSQELVSMSAIDIPASKLDATGSYSYGRMVAEPSITVKYPGVGELQIMRLSEAGVRKADTILRVRQTVSGTAFRPPARGIAQPGVPKDAADFYVTARTFLGKKIAEEWLESWAKAMGYTQAQLSTVLPKIRAAMLEVAAKTPSNIIGYKYIPSVTGKVAPGASPSIIVHVPSSLGASVSGSLAGKISMPIYPYKLSQSPTVQASVSSGLYALASKAPKALISVPKVSPVPSPSVSTPVLSYGASPSVSPVPSPSLKPSPSPGVASVLSVSPYPTPSPYPAPSPAVVGFKPKPKPPIILTVGGKKYYKVSKGSIVWRQGSRLVKGQLHPQWFSIEPPYTQAKPTSLDYPPLGAKRIDEASPTRTIQIIGRAKAKVPKSASIDMGVVDIKISNYGREISFTGKGEETVAGGGIASPTKGMSVPATKPAKLKGYAKLAFGTSLRSLTTEAYNDEIPKKFADKVLSQKLSKLTPREIAAEIQASKLSVGRKEEILKLVPDRVKSQIELWLKVAPEYAPTRGFPKARYIARPFRRKPSKPRKVLTDSEIVQSVSTLR